MEMALTYDAVRVIAETTKHLPYQPQMLNCSERHDNVQPDGSTFRNYMRSVSKPQQSLIIILNVENSNSWRSKRKPSQVAYTSREMCARVSPSTSSNCKPVDW